MLSTKLAHSGNAEFPVKSLKIRQQLNVLKSIISYLAKVLQNSQNHNLFQASMEELSGRQSDTILGWCLSICGYQLQP